MESRADFHRSNKASSHEGQCLPMDNQSMLLAALISSFILPKASVIGTGLNLLFCSCPVGPIKKGNAFLQTLDLSGGGDRI